VTSHSEKARQWIHIGSGAFAFLLRGLTWMEAAGLAATALAFNLFLLPRIGGRRLYRPADEARGLPIGILLYPLAILLLVLTFPTRLDIAGAAWGVLAFGDGMATLVGRWAGGAHWPWNRDKTIAGTIGFLICGAVGASAVAWWIRPSVVPEPSLWFVILAPLAAAIATALVETIPVRLDDNISVPLTAAAVLWLASMMTAGAARQSWPYVMAALPWALAVNLLVAWSGFRAGAVSRSGAIAGTLIGTTMYAAAGWSAWVLLFATFALASVASRLGLERKVLLGIEEDREGRRGAGNAIANCGVAAAAAVAAATTPYRAAAWLALVAALTAAGSDTVASEIGKAWGRTTFLVPTFRRVKPGTPGAVSLEGTAAGIVSALALAALAIALGHIAWSMMVVVVVAATAAAFVESLLGATLEGPGILNNDMLNFINTAVAAALVLAFT
jgi:uncharacterized protein (TIGR00297 family)